jgi:hypothetical protein
LSNLSPHSNTVSKRFGGGGGTLLLRPRRLQLGLQGWVGGRKLAVIAVHGADEDVGVDVGVARGAGMDVEAACGAGIPVTEEG